MRGPIRARHSPGVRTLRKMSAELRVLTGASEPHGCRSLVGTPSSVIGCHRQLRTALLLSSKAQTRSNFWPS